MAPVREARAVPEPRAQSERGRGPGPVRPGGKLHCPVPLLALPQYAPHTSPTTRHLAHRNFRAAANLLNQNYPLQNKYQTLEFLRTIPHLRSRLPLNSALLRLRSDAITILNNFFSGRGFTQTQPPIVTSSDCEGAGEVFTLTAGAPKPAEGAKPKERPDSFFRSPKYLTVSTQLHLEALAQSVGDVWTLSPTFRAEKSDTSRHMAEFYMLEAEMAFVEDMDTVMDLAEDMIRHLVSALSQTSPAAQDILAAAKRVTGESESLIGPAEELQARWDGLGPSAPRWPRISYTEAISLLQTARVTFEHEPVWGAALHAEHERWLATAVSEPGSRTPVFVTHYPRDTKAFYMLESDGAGANPGTGGRAPAESQTGPTVDCFDLIVPDVCEIAGGSMREHRIDHLLEAMRRNGMPAPSAKPGRGTGGLDWYVDLRRWGSPPHGGFGIGFDRLLAYLVGAQSVKDVVAFPRWWGRCDC